MNKKVKKGEFTENQYNSVRLCAGKELKSTIIIWFASISLAYCILLFARAGIEASRAFVACTLVIFLFLLVVHVSYVIKFVYYLFVFYNPCFSTIRKKCVCWEKRPIRYKQLNTYNLPFFEDCTILYMKGCLWKRYIIDVEGTKDEKK